MIKLFVGGFPLDITELELVKLFGPHADINTIKIVRDKKTRVCKGYAFVEIIDKDAVDRAIEALDGTAMGDKVLSVKITEEKPVAPKKPFPGSPVILPSLLIQKWKEAAQALILKRNGQESSFSPCKKPNGKWHTYFPAINSGRIGFSLHSFFVNAETL